jgi:hypothetical protein
VVSQVLPRPPPYCQNQVDLSMSYSPSGLSVSPERVSSAPSSRLNYDCPKNPDDHVRQPIDEQSHDEAADLSLDAPSTSTSPPGHKADDATASLPFSVSLTLQNTGSVARDHLASERTFLAYVRTSLAFASAGVGTSSRSFSLKFNLRISYSTGTAIPRLYQHEARRVSEQSDSVCTTVGRHADSIRHGCPCSG